MEEHSHGVEVRPMSEFLMNCISDDDDDIDDEDDAVPALSMLSKSASSRAPPIKLNMSHSTESAFSFEFAKSAKSAKSLTSTSRRDSAHLSPGSAGAMIEEARTRGSSTPMPTTTGLSRGAKKNKSAPEAMASSNPFARGRPRKKKKEKRRGNPFRKKKKKNPQTLGVLRNEGDGSTQRARSARSLDERKYTFPGSKGKKTKKEKKQKVKKKKKEKKRSRSRA